MTTNRPNNCGRRRNLYHMGKHMKRVKTLTVTALGCLAGYAAAYVAAHGAAPWDVIMIYWAGVAIKIFVFDLWE